MDVDYPTPSDPNHYPQDDDGNLSWSRYSPSEEEYEYTNMRSGTSSPISPGPFLVGPTPFSPPRIFTSEDILTLTDPLPSSILPKIRSILSGSDIDFLNFHEEDVFRLLESDYAVWGQWLDDNKRLVTGLMNQVYIEEVRKRQAVTEILESALAAVSSANRTASTLDDDIDTLATQMTDIQMSKEEGEDATILDTLALALSGIALA